MARQAVREVQAVLASRAASVNSEPMRVFTVLCLLLVAVIAGAVFWLRFTENFMATVATAIGAVLALAVAVLWGVFRFGGSLKVKVLTVVLGGLAVAGTKYLFRYDGSIDGSSLPRFVWRWAPGKGEGLDDLSGLKPAAAGGRDTWQPTGVYREFPGYLGPGRTGVIGGIELETDWQANPPRELWRREMGLGWSGFAVSGRHAVTQEQRDALEMVTCYDLETGEPIWAHRNETRFSEGMGGDGPRATPQIDGGRVYALGATGILDCLQLATGELVWSRAILAGNDTRNPMYGKSGSPLVFDASVVVTGGSSGPLLLAYDKATGAPLWKSDDNEAAGYAAPVLATLAGTPQIVTVNGSSVTGHASGSGSLLWRWDWPGTFPRPGQPQILPGDRVLVTASYGLDCHMLQVTAPAAGTAPWQVAELWESNRLKTKFSSACIRDGFAYGLDEGRFACMNLEDGSREWKDGRYGFGQNLLVGDVLLIQAERGQVVLVRATPDRHEELATLDALASGTKTWNPPALAGSYLLVRNDSEAACYRLPVRQAQAMEKSAHGTAGDDE